MTAGRARASQAVPTAAPPGSRARGTPRRRALLPRSPMGVSTERLRGPYPETKEFIPAASAQRAGRDAPLWRTPPSEGERQRLLEQFLHSGEELRPVGTVKDAVVADQAESHLVAG